jgi:hypothetical protein
MRIYPSNMSENQKNSPAKRCDLRKILLLLANHDHNTEKHYFLIKKFRERANCIFVIRFVGHTVYHVEARFLPFLKLQFSFLKLEIREFDKVLQCTNSNVRI